MAFILGGRNTQQQSTAPVIDLTVMSSADGAGVPIIYGTACVGANIIWSPGLVQTSITVTQSGGKGGPTTTSTQYEYTCSFAAAFCEGPGTIVKIYGDTSVLYDGTSSSVAYEGIFSSSNVYNVGQIVTFDNGSSTVFYICIRTVNALPFPNPNNGNYWSVYTGTPVDISGGQQYPSPTMYSGSSTQMPDPTIQAQLGASLTSAFRGLVYAVWENFSLNDFGNRIPSIRGVVLTGVPTGSPPGSSSSTSGVDFITTDICTRAGIPTDLVNATDLAPITTTLADVYQPDGSGIPLLTMLTGGVINFYQGGTGAPIGQCYPGDGSGGPLGNPTYTYKMPPSMTCIMNPYPADGSVGGYSSFCPGWGTTTSYDLIPAAFVGVTSGGGAGAATWDGTAVSPFVPNNVGDWSQANWDFVMNIQFQVAVAGHITFYCSSNDAVIIGIGNNATRVSGPMVNNSGRGQTKSIRSGYPIMFMYNVDDGEHDTGSNCNTFVVNFPKAGIYNVEIDYACHVDGRCMCLNWNIGTTGSPVQSPILPVNGTSGASPQAEAFGYAITEQKDARSLIEDLKSAYFFDCAESDFMVNFIRRGVHPSVMTIPEADLGLFKDGAEMEMKVIQDQDQPRIVYVSYTDPGIDYQQGSQYKLRSSRVVTSLNQLKVDLPLVFTETMALQIAEITLFTKWMERWPYEMNLWRAYYALLDVADTIDFIYNGNLYQQRITQASLGQDFQLKLEGVSQVDGAYQAQSIGTSSGGTVNPVLPAGGPSFVVIYDLPYLNDADASATRSQTGIYWFLNGASVTWPGGVFLQSPTGSVYATLGTQAGRVSYGYANAALADAPAFWTWDDTSTLSVTLDRGTLAGATDSDVLNGANALLIGNELVQFANAVQTDTQTWTISRLLRGRRNTEPFATGHAGLEGSPPQGELVVVLTGAVQRNDFGLSFIASTQDYKAVSSGGDPTAVSAQTFTSAGNDLKPAQPVFIKGTRDGSNNLTIGWIRRTRYGGDWLESTPYVPLNEDSEAYSIDIVSGMTVKRTITWTPGTYDGNGNPTASYTATQQTADSITPGNPVTVNIYQISAQVGRGFPGHATI